MFALCKAINGDKLDIVPEMFDTLHQRNFVLTFISV